MQKSNALQNNSVVLQSKHNKFIQNSDLQLDDKLYSMKFKKQPYIIMMTNIKYKLLYKSNVTSQLLLVRKNSNFYTLKLKFV